MVRKVIRDARIKREGNVRKDRDMEDRSVTQERELSDSERVDMLSSTFFQSALPDLPKIPGYHTCWLTTTNPRDPIHGRMRLGYTLVKKGDIPGWEHSTLKGGEFDGCIGINEMLAAKLPLHLFEAYMRKLHHTEPLEQERTLAAQTQERKEHIAGMGAALIEMPGNTALGTDPGAPNFSDDYR